MTEVYEIPVTTKRTRCHAGVPFAPLRGALVAYAGGEWLPGELAAVVGVSHRTLERWSHAGLINRWSFDAAAIAIDRHPDELLPGWDAA